MKIITEIGINHKGNENLADTMVDKLLKTRSSGISFQVLNNKFYTKDLKKFFYGNEKNFLKNIREKKFYIDMKKKKTFYSLKLSDTYYRKIIKKIKKEKKEVGIAISEIKKVKFFAGLKVDFFKILSKDFNNNKLIKAVLNTNVKKIYISIGNRSVIDVFNKLSKFHSKKIIIIYTQFKNTIRQNKLERINSLKNKFSLPIVFGNHCFDLNIFNHIKKYNLSSIFVYVKLNSKEIFPDNNHAVPINKINNLYKKLN